MTKRQKIERYLDRGLTASEIVKKGYSVGHVYTIAKQLREEASPKAFRAKKERAAAKSKKDPIAELIERASQIVQPNEWVQQELDLRIPEDVVNHPRHYVHGGIETIDFIESKKLSFCLGNVVKYISRAGVKTHNPLEDLKKARWYLNREIEQLEKLEK